MARDPYTIPPMGTIERQNFRDDFTPGPNAEQQELAALREFEADVRKATRDSLGANHFTAMVCTALDRFDRKRGR